MTRRRSAFDRLLPGNKSVAPGELALAVRRACGNA
jgi:hypothetical protein